MALGEITSARQPAPGLTVQRLREEPHRVYQDLHPCGPVHWCAEAGAWVVIGYVEVKQALHDNRLQSARMPMLLRILGGQDGAFQPLITFFQDWMLMNDPPRHTRLRRVFRDAFDGEILRRVAARLPAHVDALLDRARALPDADWVREVAEPLPCLVLADLLGQPDLDIAAMQVFAERVYAFFDSASERLGAARALQDSVLWLDREVHRWIRERRRDGADDLLGRLLRASDPAMSARELVATCGMMLFGANGLPRYLIANALHSLLSSPEQRRLWPLSSPGARDPARLSPEATRAMHELLRFDGPTHLLTRSAGESFTLAGREIQASDRVWLSVWAAHRDPRSFPAPDRLDLQQDGAPPLSFGSGLHRCLGATLGMLECEAALSGLLQRAPAVSLREQAPRWRPSLDVRGLQSLPITWERA